MISLFAGLDSDGVVRFVNDVPRGSACGCFCAVCESPLIARRGQIRRPHFSHEARQERPECEAGAVNLLRRLAIEQLQKKGIATLPPDSQTFVARHASHVFSETVEWRPTPIHVSDWNPRAAKRCPAARIQIENDVQLELYVDVSLHPGPRAGVTHKGVGKIQFWLPLPDLDRMQSLDQALRHVAAGQFFWLSQPDFENLAVEAQNRLAEKVRNRVRADDEIRSLHVISQLRTPSSVHPFSPTAKQNFQAGQKIEVRLDLSPWSAWRKPSSSFICWALKDGSIWIMVEHVDGRRILIPRLSSPIGWKDALPLQYGKFDAHLQGLVTTNHINTIIYLNQQSSSMLSTTNWSEVLTFK
jgi:Competence protein CoiA-like family